MKDNKSFGSTLKSRIYKILFIAICTTYDNLNARYRTGEINHSDVTT